MTKPVIGFIGLGLMGGNMVENLQKRGYEPYVIDLNKALQMSLRNLSMAMMEFYRALRRGTY